MHNIGIGAHFCTQTNYVLVLVLHKTSPNAWICLILCHVFLLNSCSRVAWYNRQRLPSGILVVILCVCNYRKALQDNVLKKKILRIVTKWREIGSWPKSQVLVSSHSKETVAHVSSNFMNHVDSSFHRYFFMTITEKLCMKRWC